MKEIIQELLRVESQAKQVVADAEAEARAEAQEQAEHRRHRETEAAQRLGVEQVETARAQKQARLEEARVANRAAARIPDELAREAIETVCRAVMGAPDATPRR